MAVLQGGCALMILAFIFHGAFLQRIERNDRDPDDDLPFIKVRNGGQNDGEPDYNPGFEKTLNEDLVGKLQK